MYQPKLQDLTQGIQLQKKEDFYIKEQKKFIEKYSSPKLQENLKFVLAHFSESENPALKIGIQSAFLGALYAFADRGLDPLYPSHFELFFTLEKEIREAFQLVSQGELDKELWIFETFDYGIKHVYYLDWKLYLSKICY